MERKRERSIVKWVFGTGLLGLITLNHAAPLITLPTGEITRLSYTGHELFYDANGNGVPERGDTFEGVVLFTKIEGAATGTEFSGQLTDTELTTHYRFSVIDHSSDFLEFGLLQDGFFNFYVGRGSAKNFDPSAPDAFARASDGELWLSIRPGLFFESVNDIQPDGNPLNRAWADVTANNTGYVLSHELLRTILGKDALHDSGGQPHGDHATQSIFENHLMGLSEFFPRFTFGVFGEFNVFAVPEPSTGFLILIGLLGFRFRRCGTIQAAAYEVRTG